MQDGDPAAVGAAIHRDAIHQHTRPVKNVLYHVAILAPSGPLDLLAPGQTSSGFQFPIRQATLMAIHLQDSMLVVERPDTTMNRP